MTHTLTQFLCYLGASSNSIRAVGGTLHSQVRQTLTQLAGVRPPSVSHSMGHTLVLTLITGVSLTPADTHRQVDRNAGMQVSLPKFF